MAWQLSLYSLLGWTGAGISALIVGLAWRHRTHHEALSFLGLMLALGGWSLVSGIQLSSTTQAGQLGWQRLGLAIGGFIPTLWLLFTVRYAGKDTWLTRRRMAALAVNPLLFGLLTLTNSSHKLIWDGVTRTLTAAGPAVRLTFSVGYYVHIAYAYLLVAIGLVLLFTVFLHGSSVYRRQTGFLILGALPPFAANIAYTLRVEWGPLPAIDPTPFAFILTGIIFGLTLFEFDLLERTPVARQRALEEMGEGLVVLDADGGIVDTNTVAREVLDPTPTVGDTLTDLGYVNPATVEEALAAFDGQTLTSTVEDRQRAYDTEWTSLTDYRGQTAGHIVTLRDVTARHQYEQRLEVAQRVLRHNLRNAMTVIQGRANQLAQTTTDDHTIAAQQIVERAENLMELSEKTRTMVRLDEYADVEQTSHEIEDHLEELVATFREEHPAATIEYTNGSLPPISVPNEEPIDIPLRNLIENAIEHNGGTNPWVEVRTSTTEKYVEIHISDDGPKIPAVEREVLETGTEQQLKHGSGMGLWLTYWSMQTVGGHVSFETSENDGNRVVLEFPRAEQAMSYLAISLAGQQTR